MMSYKTTSFVFTLVCCILISAAGNSGADDNVFVNLETNMGTITLQLFKDEAPITTDNFVKYVNDGFYDKTIFHRVIKGFMDQGGGFDTNMTQKQTISPIINESGNGLSNAAYTIAMARTSVPDSATSQFFINAVDNPFLDKKYAQDGVGYAVFGKTIAGKSVVDAINVVPTTTVGVYSDVPKSQVVINKAVVINSPVCFSADDTLAIVVSCAQYHGIQYGFTLNYTPVKSDPTGIYWKMNIPTFSQVRQNIDACMPVSDDLKLNLCAEYHALQYEVVLNSISVSGDSAGIYWKADTGTFKQRN